MKKTYIILILIIAVMAFCITASLSYNANIAPVTLYKTAAVLQDNIKNTIKETADITDKYSDIMTYAEKFNPQYSEIFDEIKIKINSTQRIDKLEEYEKTLTATIYEIINLTEYSADMTRLNQYRIDIQYQTEILSKLKQQYNRTAELYNHKTINNRDKYPELLLFSKQ